MNNHERSSYMPFANVQSGNTSYILKKYMFCTHVNIFLRITLDRAK